MLILKILSKTMFWQMVFYFFLQILFDLVLKLDLRYRLYKIQLNDTKNECKPNIKRNIIFNFFKYCSK